MRVQSTDAAIASNRAQVCMRLRTRSMRPLPQRRLRASQADACLPSPEVSRDFCARLLAMQHLITFLVDAAQRTQ